MKKLTIILLCLVLTSLVLLGGCAGKDAEQCKQGCYDVFAKEFNSTNGSLSVTEIKALWEKKSNCLSSCDK